MSRGKYFYLTQKEQQILIDVANEWLEIMESGEETFKLCDETLNNGLGSALKKLHKDRNGYEMYKDY